MKVRLKELCEQNGITPYVLAIRINVDRNTVYSWANNKTFPRPSQLEKLLDYFKCEVPDLIVKD
jgi:transcriptional regulator with XRE-family HTH domain